ncbi:VOC family protein [Propionicimonas sp.]|uniref:VOC family protein n=1 Tax=Propionicimonas sp. TaxID=1955623 RepID=UPI0039E390A3
MNLDARVLPMRFSADVAAMADFLAVLGLRRVRESVDGEYVVLDGSAGSVAVHAAEPDGSGTGLTTLNVLLADLPDGAAALADTGLDATTWDEAYGMQGAVWLPAIGAVGLNEAHPADLHGYRSLPARLLPKGGLAPRIPGAKPPFGSEDDGGSAGPSPIRVLAVRYSDNFTADAALFACLGFRPAGSLEDPWWCVLEAGSQAGAIGLHAGRQGGPAPTEAPGGDWLDHPALVGLGFETAEPLDALAARLRANGHGARLEVDEAGPKVVVTDPDGQVLEVHPEVSGP